MDKEQIRSTLKELGYADKKIAQVLKITTNQEEAIDLIMNLEDEDEWESFTEMENENEPEDEIVMIIVVRDDLEMSNGKMGAQVGHGVLGAYKIAIKNCPKNLKKWEETGEKKLFFHVSSETDLNKVWKKGVDANVPTSIITDAGRTQIASGSKTVTAIGPGFVISEKIQNF